MLLLGRNVRPLDPPGAGQSATIPPPTPAFLQLNDTIGAYASRASLNLSGSIDLQARVSFVNWNGEVLPQIIIGKTASNPNQSYSFRMQTTGKLNWAWSTTGVSLQTRQSTQRTFFTNGTVHWIRVTVAATGGDVKFWTGDDGLAWTQLGATVGSTFDGTIHATTLPTEIGSQDGGGLPFNGRIYRINSPIPFNPDGFVASSPPGWSMHGAAQILAV